MGEFEIVPLRGNVPTRIAKIEREGLDGVVLAAGEGGDLGVAAMQFTFGGEDGGGLVGGLSFGGLVEQVMGASRQAGSS